MKFYGFMETYAYFEFDGSNTLEKLWNENEKKKKNKPNISQLIRSV